MRICGAHRQGISRCGGCVCVLCVCVRVRCGHARRTHMRVFRRGALEDLVLVVRRKWLVCGDVARTDMGN